MTLARDYFQHRIMLKQRIHIILSRMNLHVHYRCIYLSILNILVSHGIPGLLLFCLRVKVKATVTRAKVKVSVQYALTILSKQNAIFIGLRLVFNKNA